MSRKLRALLAFFTVALMMSGSGLMVSTAAATPGGQVCEGLDSGKIDTTGDPATVTVTAPDGKLIDGYCVKAGSTNSGDGPVYRDVVPPKKSVTIAYPSGKAISHYSVSYTDMPDQPDSKVTYTEWVDGDKSCESKTVTQTRTKTVTPYVWNGSEWVLDTANATSTTETQTRPMTEAELKECEGTPPPMPPAGMSMFSLDCESLEIKPATGVKPEGADYQYYLDGKAIAVGSHELAPGDYTLTLKVDGKQVDSDTFKVKECEQPPSYVVTVVPNQGDCEVRTPAAQVTTGFASSIGYRLEGENTKFLFTEVPAGTYTLTLPGVNPGENVSYEVVVTPLDDSAEPIVKGPFNFSVAEDCDEVPPCTEFQDEDVEMPCYVEREPDIRTVTDERSNCKLGGTEVTTAVFTTTWSFNEMTQQWESSETAVSSVSFAPFTAAELAACNKTPETPNPENPNPPTTTGTPTSTPPTFVPPSTGGGTWPSDFDAAVGAGQSDSLGKLMVLLGGLVLAGALLAPRRRRGLSS